MVMTNLDRDFPAYSDGVSRAATHWLIALQDSPQDPDLRAAFELWRTASPEHAVAWAETEQAAGLIAAATRRRQARPIVPRQRIAVAAAFALAASIAMLLLPGLLQRWTADAATQTAEIRKLHLPDGSTVTLGPESAIDIAFDDRRRLIRLLAGRAFFEVVPDASHPFVVSARQVDTTVTGTAFDVRLAEGGVEVAVQRGHVRVEDGTAAPPVQASLVAGDWIEIGPDGAVSRLQRPAAQVTAWQQGKLVAIDRPVGDVVDEFRAYFGGRIVLLDSALAAKRVTGVYDLTNPAAGLRALAAAHGAKVTAVTDWILVISRG
jgi:transmembrane sensor